MSDISENDLEHLLNTAEDLTGGRIVHADNLRVSVTASEILLDFYVLTPKADDPYQREAQRVQRLAIPASLAQDFAQKLKGEDTPQIAPSLNVIPGDDSTWSAVEALYGAWSSLDDNKVEAWMDSLRDDRRLNDLYD